MYYYLIILISALSASSFSGRVVDNLESPVSSVNIEIVDYGVGTLTDRDGYFFINKIPSSNFTIKVSHIGYYDQFIDVDINDNNVVIKLSEKVIDLSQIVITGDRRETYIEDSPILTRVINSKDIE